MNTFLLALVLQSSLLLPPRTALENPAVISQIPQKLRKDYDKMWLRFVTAAGDMKLVKDLDKLLQKQKSFDAAWMIQGYLALYKGDDIAAQEKFTQALALNPAHRTAMYYLSELAYMHGQYFRAATLYAQLLLIDNTHPEIETKRQKAFLLATDDLLRAAARSEAENRLAEAEEYYRQALLLAPKEPVLHARLADLLIKQDKKEAAEAERKAAEALMPRSAAKARATDEVKSDLEDLGRWGSDIELFHQIRDAEAVTREQMAILTIRYFPQVTEFRQIPQIITDIEDSPAKPAIQTVVGIGLMDPRPNHDFEPAALVTRGDLAKALARLSRLLEVSGSQSSSNPVPDVAETNAMFADIQLVLGHGLMGLADSGSFNVFGPVSGPQAVRSLDRLLRIFQQIQR
jgi:tetratricopeptide (TPR) repeat protein